ncbi:OsmC family protein [Aidingimonas halophila]|uniref:Organic hydroperoxide reductase OsmC/OhrA n=1 Tax=Aidingimonas halophila TaxID=574349 RepID=A0A1H3EDQ6_9GAMM|nr:OsmC family protein [Aidingimonas halophila]GHC33623.1 peroxiredoxin [Aidingimonas halophila]SDX76765.1 Organic hydroperoxide reductase OsmC/OhrA [Aidingimonas halophila]
MSQRDHRYQLHLTWTGNRGSGTSAYRDYDRDMIIDIPGKPALHTSADPAFLGNPDLHNPEDMLVSSLSACHMLWYLHLCSDAGIVVTAYTDDATGHMTLTRDGGGHFTQVTLRPRVTIATGCDAARAERLHARAHELCFIANSVNFPVACEAEVEAAE